LHKKRYISGMLPLLLENCAFRFQGKIPIWKCFWILFSLRILPRFFSRVFDSRQNIPCVGGDNFSPIITPSHCSFLIGQCERIGTERSQIV
ncbi:hypothetical protein T08_1977, partial [Trichinella sp. T8]